MRKIYVLRGAAGSGKSTFINKRNLELNTISIQNIFPSKTEMNTVGAFVHKNLAAQDRHILIDAIQSRMNRGETIYIDGRNLKLKDVNFYRQIADDNRYELYVVNFDISLEQLEARNKKRNICTRISKKELLEQYETIKNTKLPNEIQTISPYEIIPETFTYNLSQYNKIHHIGDVHGYYYPLSDAVPEIKEDEFYIFTGDYFSKGFEAGKVFEFLYEISSLPNVVLIEGNHESELWKFACSDDDIFTYNYKYPDTIKQLVSAGIDKKKIKRFCRRLKTYYYYRFGDKKVFVCHGGIPKIPNDLSSLASNQLIYGVGAYDQSQFVDDMFVQNVGDREIYSIHGHRSELIQNVCVNSKCFNIDSGKTPDILRTVTLTKDGFATKSYE